MPQGPDWGQGRLVAWFGREYFAGSLPDFGWELKLLSHKEPRLFSWEQIVDFCGRPPQAVVLGDRSLPPAFAGLEQYPCLTVFYCVDSHIHSWYPLYAQAFDACVLSLKDHLGRFAHGRLTREDFIWLPAFAPNPQQLVYTPGHPVWDLLFVGRVDPETTPGRYDFLERLGALPPGLVVRQGQFFEIFPFGRVLLNVAELGDLNFRVFEALAMGQCLLTPRVGHGLLELFQDGVDLLTYEPGNAQDAAQKAQWLLARPDLRKDMGHSGQAKVDQTHRAWHRARDLSAFLAQKLAQGVERRLAMAKSIRDQVLRPLHLHWAEVISDPEMKKRYLLCDRSR